jgi:hypothetical protein
MSSGSDVTVATPMSSVGSFVWATGAEVIGVLGLDLNLFAPGAEWIRDQTCISPLE